MQYRSDKYGNQISVLGYGCMRFTQKAGRPDVDKTEKEMYTLLPKDYPVFAVMEAVKNSVMYREYSIINKLIEVILTKNSIIVISPGQLVSKSNMFGDMGYNKRNMWIYDKLISLDEGKRFINDGNGLVRIKEA